MSISFDLHLKLNGEVKYGTPNFLKMADGGYPESTMGTRIIHIPPRGGPGKAYTTATTNADSDDDEFLNDSE
jgi:hypothetical protein